MTNESNQRKSNWRYSVGRLMCAGSICFVALCALKPTTLTTYSSVLIASTAVFGAVLLGKQSDFRAIWFLFGTACGAAIGIHLGHQAKPDYYWRYWEEIPIWYGYYGAMIGTFFGGAIYWIRDADQRFQRNSRLVRRLPSIILQPSIVWPLLIATAIYLHFFAWIPNSARE